MQLKYRICWWWSGISLKGIRQSRPNNAASHGYHSLIQVCPSRELQNPISLNSHSNEVWADNSALGITQQTAFHAHFVYISEILPHIYFIIVAYSIVLMRGRTLFILRNSWKCFCFEVSWDMLFCWCYYASSSLFLMILLTATSQ